MTTDEMLMQLKKNVKAVLKGKAADKTRSEPVTARLADLGTQVDASAFRALARVPSHRLSRRN